MRLALLCLLFTGCATTWTPSEQIAFSLNVGCNYADYASTEYALGTGRYEEANPLLGKNPSDGTLIAVKALATGAAWWVGDTFEQDVSVPLLLVMSAPCAWAVVNNFLVLDD